MLPKHLLDQGIDLNVAENIIDFQSGSGPFVLDEYQRGNFYKVSRNPNYFKEGRPFFDSIDHFIINEASTVAAAFITGQIDMSNGGLTNLTPAQSLQLERDTSGLRAVRTSPSANWGLMMNVKKQPFDDARVRQAIQLAIDYQQWNDLVFEGTSTIGCPLMDNPGLGQVYVDGQRRHPGLQCASDVAFQLQTRGPVARQVAFWCNKARVLRPL